MAQLFTRAQFRDRLRRKAQIVPPIDVPGLGGQPGDQPTNAPLPTNAQINDAFTDAIADINRECGYHVSSYSVPVAAALSNQYGAFTIALGTLTPNTSTSTVETPTAIINNIQRVLWTSSSSAVPVLLTPVVRDSMDRNGFSQYYANTPGTPVSWYIQGYTLNIIPAQNIAGTYTLICGTGISGFVNDQDTLDQISIDEQNVFEDRAMYRIAITQTQDVEWQERAQSYGQLSMTGMAQLKNNRMGDAASMPGVTFASFRNSYGTRRLVR